MERLVSELGGIEKALVSLQDQVPEYQIISINRIDILIRLPGDSVVDGHPFPQMRVHE